MMADNGPGRQRLRKPFNLFRVGLALLTVRGIVPPNAAVPRVGITSPTRFWIGGFFLARTMRGKSDDVIPIQPGA